MAANLLVPAGVLLFGWNAAAAVFLLWLDTLLLSLQLGVVLFAAAKPLVVRPPEVHGGGWAIGIGIGLAFVLPLFLVPPLIVGAELHELLKRHFPQGPFAVAFADRLIYLAIAVEVLVRGVQVLGRVREVLARPEESKAYAAQGAQQFASLVMRMVVLIMLAWLAAGIGRPGLLGFLLAAGAFLAYSELNESWLRRLQERLEKA